MRIVSANKMKVYDSNDLPDMSEGVQMFFQNIFIEILHKQNSEGFLQEFAKPVRTQGVRVTQTPQQLAMKPEGQRDWKWSNLFMLPEPKLRVDDIVKIQGTKYRVMQKSDNKEYGVCSYELLEDYNDE